MKTTTLSQTKNRLSAGRLAHLERSGVVRRAQGPRLSEILTVAPPSPEPGADGVRALLEERRTGR